MLSRGRFCGFLLVLIMFLACVFSVQAQTLINNCTGGYNITVGGHYLLNNSIANNRTCINILVNDVFLDCQGHAITGNLNGSGIVAQYVQNSTIQNCIVHNFTNGIYLNHSNQSLVRNNTAYNNSAEGFSLVSSVNDTFVNNTAYDNDNGFQLDSSRDNILINNTAYNHTNFGFKLQTASHRNNITNNLAYNNAVGFCAESGSNSSTFHQNTAENNRAAGILVHAFSHNAIVTENQVRNNSHGGICIGSALGSSNNARVIGNNVSFSTNTSLYAGTMDLSGGIFLNSILNATLINNTAHNNSYGIRLCNSSNNNLTGNVVHKSSYGFYITNQSSNNTFTGNTANNNSEGFRIEINATHNTFNNNRAINNSVFGIDFPGPSCLFNAFTSSILSNPAGWDLHMDSPNLSFYNATLGAEYAPVKVSFTRYNGTMRMTGVQNPPADPAGWVNIAKYVNISKPVGTYLVLNISYSAADIANVQENTLRLLRFTGTWVGTNSTVYAAQNFVSARLTNYSSFGLFGQQQQQQRISGGGGGSATRAFYRILESEGEELRENQVVEKKMRSNDVFAFKMNAVKHALTVLNIDSAQKQVIIRIASVPKTYVLKLGKTVNVDADGNGYDDLAITLKSVLVGSADFVIQRIPENIPAPAALQVSDAGLEEPEEDVYAEHVAEPAPVEPAPVTEPRQALQPAVKSRSSNNGLIIALLVIAFAVAYYFMYGSRGRKKKHH